MHPKLLVAKRYLVTAACAAVLLALALGWPGLKLFSQAGAGAGPLPAEEATVSLRVRFGTGDTQALPWDGTLEATGGEVLALRDWRPHPEDRIEGKNSWKLSTRKGINFTLRPVEEEPLTDPTPYLWQAGLIVDLKATSGTRVKFTTKQGEFEVAPANVAAGDTAKFLGGRVAVNRVPTARVVSTSGSEADFPTMLSGANGEVWVAWIAYRNQANSILARRFDGRAWGPVQPLVENGDVFLVKMARDAKGRAWAVWSQQVNGNWDLYGRRLEGQNWGATERLTTAPQPDLYPVLASDSQGALWLAWQGFRGGQGDIHVRRNAGDSWGPEETVSTSRANDWAPAIAADGAGSVYVAWDTYDKGNYDVVMRRFRNGKWTEVAAIADTPKYEAHVSLACDKDNRLWAAWNESGMQWGKDTGFLLTRQSTALYRSRWMSVAVYNGSEWQEPAAALEPSLPEELRGYNDLPVLQTDGAGRVWLFFRHRTNRVRDTPATSVNHRALWEIWGVSYEGDGWKHPVFVPFSQGRTDVRGGFASDGKGGFYAAWATDNRDFEQFLFRHSEVYAGRLPATPAPAAAPRLKARAIPALKTYNTHGDEPADLQRIRGYGIQSGGKTYHIYRGDIHRHTEFSFDGNNDGSLLDCYRYSLDAAGMDFLGVSDHNNLSGPDVEYVRWLGQQAADMFVLPGSFIALCAYERSVSYPNGHRNILFADRGKPTLPTPPDESRGRTGAAELYKYLRALGGIAVSHTSAGTMGTDWRDNDKEVEPLVEIYQGDRVSSEYEGAPKAAYEGDPTQQPGGFKPAGYIWNAWAKGYKLGVQCSSDHLSTHISYACTLATDFSRAGLLDGMRQRHSYGATDNIVLDYRMEAGGKEFIQGDIGAASGSPKLVVKVLGTRPIRQIDIIRNNGFIHTRAPLTKDVNFTFVDPQPVGGESYYYVRVIQVDEQMAWSSPIWITRGQR